MNLIEIAKNCLSDIANYKPLYGPQPEISARDKWTQYKYWAKNYATIAGMTFKVGGPIKLVKYIIEYPWLYDMVKANAMFQRCLYGRTGNYREAIALVFDEVVHATVDMLSVSVTTPDKLVLLEDMVPPEILRAMGLYNWVPEIFGILGTMIDQHASERYIDFAENAGVAPDSCTLPKLTQGISIAGHCPKGAVAVSSNLPCDSGATSYTLITQKAGNIPIYRLDVPHYFREERGVELFVEDMKQMIAWLEEHTAGRMDWNKLREICERRNRATELEMELWELNRRKPTAMPGEPIWLWHLFSCNIIPGTESAVRGWEKVLELAKKNYAAGIAAQPKERYRALVWNPVPAMFSDMAVWMEQVWGITIYIDSMSYHTNPLIDTTSPDTMLRDLSIAIMNGPMARHTRGPADNYFTDMFNILEGYQLDMLIMAGHVGCKNTQALNNMMREKCREKNIPCLIFDYDLMDPRVVSQDGIKSQINHFMENVMKAERLSNL